MDKAHAACTHIPGATPSPQGVFRAGGGGEAFFVIRGEGEILEEAGTFSGQALLLSYPYPRGGGGPVKEAGTHSPPCPQYLPNIKPHAMHQVVKGSEVVYIFHFESIPSQNLSLDSLLTLAL